MKKIIFTGAFLLLAMGTKAQSDPFYDADGTLKNDRTVDMSGFFTLFKALDGEALFINGTSGDVGIGTMTPSEKLDVNGTIQAKAGIFTTAPLSGSYATNEDRVNATLAFTAGYPVSPTTKVRSLSFMDMPVSNIDTKPAMWFSITDRDNSSRLRFRCETGGSSQFMIFDKFQQPFLVAKEDEVGSYLSLYDPNQQPYFRVQNDPSGAYLIMDKPNSNVCIGTNTNTDGDGTYYKLSVSGKIRAYEVKVYNTWADYVFEDDYVLRPLEEVEQFINENGHLPNVPSAEIIEEKGLELGNMMKIQQEKIEELTLYLIEQKKENNELKKDVEELKALVKALTEKE